MFITYAAYANVVAIRSNIIRSVLLWVFTHLYRTTIWGAIAALQISYQPVRE